MIWGIAMTKLLLKNLRNTSVKMKVLGITLGLVLLMGITSIFVVRESLVIKLSEDLDRRAISIASDLSSRTTDFTILHDLYSLHKLLQQTKSNNPDIEYIFILDHQGEEVLIHTLGSKYDVTRQLIEFNHINELEENEYQMVSYLSENGVIHDVVAPILDGDVGYVRVGLNENQIKATINDLSFIIIISTTVISIIGFIISFILTKIIYKDLLKLIKVSKEVGKGNLNTKVEIESKDEIGLLGEEFNTMIDRLRTKNDENMAYLQELQMRNNELSLLHQLSVTFLDGDSFHKHLNHTAKKLKEDLNLQCCYIEISLNDEKIQTFHGNGSGNCDNCVVNGGAKCFGPENYHIFPLETSKQNTGKVSICFKEDPDEVTLKFINSFIRQLSVIVENALLWQEIKYKEELRLKLLERVISAQEEERKRIARELHDETSQSLATIVLGVTMLEETEQDQQLRNKLTDLRKITEKTIDEVHYLSWSLRPSALDDYGLLPAIKKYAEEFKKKYDIEVDIQVIGFEEIRLPSVVEISIYRVIQEALTNAARHADAENISIIIKHVKNVVSFIIEDDGNGFNAKETVNRKLTKNHLGLKGMQERIESIGGRFFIESNPGMGTSIYVNDIKIGGVDYES